MSYKNSIKCGPNVTDNFDDWIRISNTGNNYRCHSIIGSGVINSCKAQDLYPCFDDRYITVDNEITEFADNCFNKVSVSFVSVPTKLKKIGSHCFEKSNITSLTLPDTLEEIGHNNFPKTLNSIFIPPLIKDFPIDNLFKCDKITEIKLHKDNTTYKVIDGILYNNDITEIIYCPNGKVGKVIIPDSVKIIGDYCFYNNKKLTAIIIPTSIVSIGNYAFNGVQIEKLEIPNSVINIGDGCFWGAKISKKLKLSSKVSTLPKECFNYAEVPYVDYTDKINNIGDYALSNMKYTQISNRDILKLQSTVHIGNNAFYEDKNVRIFELFSSLETISKNAFDKTVKNLVVKFFSFTPINIERDAFQGLSENSTLMVPKGTKLIFEKALPWSVFDNIEEMDLESNLVDSQEEVLSVDEYKFRLESVANSIYKVDREYLRNIIQDLSYDYLNVSTDEEYNEALSLIAYNNRFNPPILPNLDVVICKSWESKYRLRILGKSILEYGNVPALDNFIANGKVYNDISSIPFLNTETICLESNLLPLRSNIVVESYFENILSKIQNELLDAEHDVKIAVSWFTNYDLFKTVNELADKGINIEIVINNDLINNGGYCLNFDELISKESVRFYLVEYPHLLHHKFCIIDDKTIINGSYNWTRFSGSNYENIMIIRNDVNAVSAFNDEFERILHQAEYKNIDKMPDNVPERPEYDRSAFKQYITEELDSAAHEISNERDKITILHKASCLNPEYFEKINPSAKKKFADAFRVLEDQPTATKDVIEMIDSCTKVFGNEEQNKIDEIKGKESENLEVNNKKTDIIDIIPGSNHSFENISVSCQLKEKFESTKASSLFLVLDVSGSMDNLYKAGHVHNIAEQVLSVSLTISESKEISLWKFGDRADFVENIGLENIQSVKNVHCEGTGTELNAFVNAASGSINDGSLVIIFTDDDLGSIKKAALNIKNKSKVFWQIIVYGEHKNISSEISNCSNVSLICMDDYASKSKKEINQMLLNDYILWKNK